MKVKAMVLWRRPHLACILFLLSACLHCLSSGQCQTAGRFGEDCQHQCHCQQTCDFTTGICPTRCTEGYEGPTCQMRNVALEKKAMASSTHYSGRWTADKAVDGDTRQDVFTGACFLSALNSKPTTWSVDLGDVYPMDNIVIYYRTGLVYRFRTAKIIVANSTGGEVLCATGNSPTEESNAVLRFNCSSSGSRLILRQDGNCGECILEPCEVQVFVCTIGNDGQNCTGRCGHCSDGANCHHETGSCLSGSCQPGYRGDRCDQDVSTTVAPLQCPASCQSMYSGSAYTAVLGIGIAIGMALCLAVFVVSSVVFCFVRRYQLGRDKNASPGSQRGEGTTQNMDATVHYNTSSRPAAEEGNSPYESLDASTRNPDVPNEYVSIRTRDNGEGATEARGASAQDTASSRPAEVDGNSPYESLDTSTRIANVPSDYVSLGSRTK